MTITKSTTNDIPVMAESEWTRIHQIQAAYSEAIATNQVVGVPLYPAVHPIHNTLELIRIPTYLASIRLISYLKKIPEFHLLDSEDRVTLVQHNLLAVVFIHTVLLYDPLADTYHEHNTQDPIFEGKDWIEILGEESYDELTATVKKLIQVLEYDRVVIKIVLLIVLFTKGFCAYDILHEPNLNQGPVVLNIHSGYVETLYRYCLHQYGLTRTTTLFTNLVSELFSIQRLAIRFKDLVHRQVDASQLSPLMQTVLQLSDSNPTIWSSLTVEQINKRSKRRRCFLFFGVHQWLSWWALMTVRS